MSANFKLEALDASFGAVVTGLDVERLGEEDWAALYLAWLRHALLVFPGLHLTPDQQLAFAERFGPLEGSFNPLEDGRFPITNIKPDGTLLDAGGDTARADMLRGNYDWHSDKTYWPLHSKGALFVAEVVPQAGGETGFADMRAAYDSLDPSERARLDGLTVHHSIRHAQTRRGYAVIEDEGFAPEVWPGPLRPLVKIHPETGRKSLLIGRHCHSVSGMGEAESERFLDDLLEAACQPPRVYFHAWKPGDAVLWDNRCLLHCVKPWDIAVHPRRMWHTPIVGDPATEMALALEEPASA
jgi:alpha-ketoglutarate-dependent taurine dioxygenase